MFNESMFLCIYVFYEWITRWFLFKYSVIKYLYFSNRSMSKCRSQVCPAGGPVPTVTVAFQNKTLFRLNSGGIKVWKILFLKHFFHRGPTPNDPRTGNSPRTRGWMSRDRWTCSWCVFLMNVFKPRVTHTALTMRFQIHPSNGTLALLDVCSTATGIPPRKTRCKAIGWSLGRVASLLASSSTWTANDLVTQSHTHTRTRPYVNHTHTPIFKRQVCF